MLKFILAIETSCDETAAAVVSYNSKWITPLSNVVSSQIKLHAITQGVVPEVAARAHLKKINPVVSKALREAGKTLDQIDHIAVTVGPGLITSLLVGSEYAKALSFASGKTIIPTNHMDGHLYSSFLADPKLKTPSMNLIVSGGHTYLVLIKKNGKTEVIGTTIDDAVGEAFDKVARMLKLPYPGGPEISKYALKGRKDYDFPRPMLNSRDFDFSFAGLKTAVLYKIRDEKINIDERQNKADLAFSFQNAAVDVLVKKTVRAAIKHKVKSITLSGGVAANKSLRASLTQTAKKHKLKVYVPAFNLCTDNALMIAHAAAIKAQRNFKPVKYGRVKVDPGLSF